MERVIYSGADSKLRVGISVNENLFREIGKGGNGWGIKFGDGKNDIRGGVRG